MTSCERIGPWLDGYHDGELGSLRRWWLGRHLAGCTRCRGELASLAQLGVWMREAASAPPAPDLWAGVAARLPSPEPRLEPARARASRSRELAWRWGSWFSKPILGGAVAAAAVAGVLLVHPVPLPDAPPGSVVRSINPHGRPVMVLEGGRLEGGKLAGKDRTSPTIIWMMDAQHDPNPEEVADVTI